VLHFSGGRQQGFPVSTVGVTNGFTNIDHLTDVRMTGNTTNGYTIAYPDSSQDAYNFVITPPSPTGGGRAAWSLNYGDTM
jgi:hypothetical protein